MFDFHFAYSDGNTYDVKNVTKIKVMKSSGMTEISGDNILSDMIPLKSMCLYTDNGNISISGKDLMVIDVLKQ